MVVLLLLLACATTGSVPPQVGEPTASTTAAASTPAAVVSAYYAAIETRDYRAAWLLWESDGAASGKTLDAFTAGFAETVHSRVEVGTATEPEGAAGSLYVSVPVDVYASLRDGTRQHFTGSYTLRRANGPSDVSPPPWRIHDARLTAAP